MKAIIFVKGGLVQAVYSDEPGLKIDLVDYDNVECFDDEAEKKEFERLVATALEESKTMTEVF